MGKFVEQHLSPRGGILYPDDEWVTYGNEMYTFFFRFAARFAGDLERDKPVIRCFVMKYVSQV